MNKGVEGLPLNILIAVITISIVVSLSIFEISEFRKFSEQKKFYDSISSILNTINQLKVGNYGSFSMVKVYVPVNETLVFSNITNEIITKGRNFTTDCVFINNLTLTNGTWNIELFYGESQTLKDYMIMFK